MISNFSIIVLCSDNSIIQSHNTGGNSGEINEVKTNEQPGFLRRKFNSIIESLRLKRLILILLLGTIGYVICFDVIYLNNEKPAVNPQKDTAIQENTIKQKMNYVLNKIKHNTVKGYKQLVSLPGNILFFLKTRAVAIDLKLPKDTIDKIILLGREIEYNIKLIGLHIVYLSIMMLLIKRLIFDEWIGFLEIFIIFILGIILALVVHKDFSWLHAISLLLCFYIYCVVGHIISMLINIFLIVILFVILLFMLMKKSTKSPTSANIDANKKENIKQ